MVACLYRRILLACLLAALLFQPAAAQYYLNVRGQKLDLPARSFAVEQVVDGRVGRPPIGVVYLGLNDRPTVAMFEHGLEPELTAWLQEQLPARPTDRPVVLCVRQLRISENMTRLREEARADLALDVYAHLPDGYHYLQSAAAHTAQRALLSTGLHGGQLAELLQQCLLQLREEAWAASSRSPALSLGELSAPEKTEQLTAKAALAAPIMRQPPQVGVYGTFGEFMANTPTPGLRAIVQTGAFSFGPPNARQLWQGVPRLQVRIVDEGGQDLAVRHVWGIADGRQLYVQHQKQFFRLHRYHHFFTFVGEAPGDVAYMQAQAQNQARARVGGTTIPGVDHSAEPMGYAVDMRTGEAGEFPDPLQPRAVRVDTAYIYLYRYADPSPAPVAFSLDNRAAGQLKPREYVEIPYPYPGRMLRLCLELPGLPCQLVIPNPGALNYLRVTTSAATGRPLCEWVTPEQGEADLDEIDRQRTAPR